jgi:hypothetical protein
MWKSKLASPNKLFHQLFHPEPQPGPPHQALAAVDEATSTATNAEVASLFMDVVPYAGDPESAAVELSVLRCPIVQKTLIVDHPGQNQHATQEAWFLDGCIFNRLRA